MNTNIVKNNYKFNIPFASRVALFFCILLLALLIGGVVTLLVMRAIDNETAAMRIMAVIQDVLIFILPSIATAMIITRLPASFLCLDKSVSIKSILLVLAIMFVSMPAMNYIISWNESVTLPESMSNIEQWMRDAEQNARESINVLLGGATMMDLVLSILIVGVLTGFSEEILFRGMIQRLIQTATSRINVHVAIWVTAFIFSAIHLQFFGFFPRLLLGAFFGYLMWWSGSLWLPIIAHAFNNSMVAIFTWLYQRGDTEMDLNKVGAESFDSNYVVILVSLIITALMIILLRKLLGKKF